MEIVILSLMWDLSGDEKKIKTLVLLLDIE